MAEGSTGAAGGLGECFGRLWFGMGCKIFGSLLGWLGVWPPFLGFPLLPLALFLLPLAAPLATCTDVRNKSNCVNENKSACCLLVKVITYPLCGVPRIIGSLVLSLLDIGFHVIVCGSMNDRTACGAFLIGHHLALGINV